MKLYLDENLSDKIARAAREHGVDVISSHECGAGVLIVARSLRQSDIGRLVRALVAYHKAHPGAQFAYSVDYLRPATN